MPVSLAVAYLIFQTAKLKLEEKRLKLEVLREQHISGIISASNYESKIPDSTESPAIWNGSESSTRNREII